MASTDKSDMSTDKSDMYDTTHLPLDSAAKRRYLHRDYIAHVFRWAYATRICSLRSVQTERILDVGCGREMPFAKSIYTARLGSRHRYLGVDFGSKKKDLEDFSFNSMKSMHTMFETDFMDVTDDDVESALGGMPDLVVCFEVMEHMPPQQAVKLLERIRALMHEDSTFILSTPNYDADVGAADNHVCEWTYEAKEDILSAVGFDVQKRYGVFASQKDYKHLLSGRQLEAFKEMRDFLPACAISTVFAPMFPAEARNALHVLKVGDRAPLSYIPHVDERKGVGSFEGDWSAFDAQIADYDVDYDTDSNSDFW